MALITRRTAAALLASAVAGVGAVLLAASVPPPLAPSPPSPAAVHDLPLAPGAVRLPPRADRPAAPASVLTAAPDGRALLWTEGGTGVVRRAPVDGSTVGASQVLARLNVRRGASAGVRGLTVAEDGRIYAAYVRAEDGRLTVAEISLPTPRIVWVGPHAGRSRVGGGLAAVSRGRLALAIGDQGRATAAHAFGGAAGRVLTVQAAGPPTQAPHRRTRGWHDPTAFHRGTHGALWVADRAGGPDAERLGRGDRPRAGAVRSPVRRAPIGLAVSGDGRTLIVCGYLSGRVDRTRVRGEGAGSQPEVLPLRCRYGVAVLRDRVFVSGDDGRIRAAGTVRALRRATPLTRPGGD